MNKKLIDLDPGFGGAGGDGVYRKDENGILQPVPRREGIGLSFTCPCGCEELVYVDFSNPIDGNPPYRADGDTWERVGDDFENLTLHPSIQRVGGCNWHGWIKKGEVITV